MLLNSIAEDINPSISSKNTLKIKLILEELILNAWLHGYNADNTKTLSLQIEIEALPTGDITLLVGDNSLPFDPTSFNNMQQQYDEIGHNHNGIKLIDNFSNSWRYQYKSGRNINCVGIA